jgi:hypothetical protein
VLPGGLRLLAGAQRDALIMASTTRPGTIFSLRVERASVAPGFSHLAQRTGVVFLDLNDNGERDRGEPGLAGVVVRAGAQRATSDRSGRYMLPTDDATPAIDVRSLADGQRAGEQARRVGRDLPVRVTTRLEVSVRREQPFGRAATATGSIIVRARDAAGREWSVVADAAGRAQFDALPSGLYSVSAESDNANAPLRIEPASVRIDARDAAVLRVELVSRGRPIRMQGGGTNNGSSMAAGTAARTLNESAGALQESRP